MIPSLFEQLQKARIPNAGAMASMARKDERLEELIEWMKGKNVTTQSAAKAMNISETTVRIWLKSLVAQRRVISWTVNRNFWFSLSQAELTRQKRF